MWILASSQGTSFPFIQIWSDFGKDMRRDSSRPRIVDGRDPRPRVSDGVNDARSRLSEAL